VGCCGQGEFDDAAQAVSLIGVFAIRELLHSTGGGPDISVVELYPRQRREQLGPIELAAAVRRYVDRHRVGHVIVGEHVAVACVRNRAKHKAHLVIASLGACARLRHEGRQILELQHACIRSV